MSAFVAGIIFGGLLTGAIVTLLITRTKSPKRVEPIEWQEDYFEDPPPPPVIKNEEPKKYKNQSKP